MGLGETGAVHLNEKLAGHPAVPEAPMVKLWIRDVTPSFTPLTGLLSASLMAPLSIGIISHSWALPVARISVSTPISWPDCQMLSVPKVI